MKKFIKSELSNWKLCEVLWIFIATIIILGLSIYWKDSIVGIIAALTGVWCVILTGKGKISSYIFGTINVLFYAYIAFQAKYYGEVMLNLIYYLPMNFVGWVMWKKHLDSCTGEVKKNKMSVRNSILVYIGTAILIYLYGLILKYMGGNLPFADSMSTVISIVAQILCVKRLAEQWILWIVVDCVTIIMWAFVFFTEGESIATLLMWSIYLINAIIMYVKWHKEVNKNEI